MTSHVLSGLVAKRAEIGGEIEFLRRKLDSLEFSVEHLDQTILLFDPDYKPQRIKPRRKVSANKWFARGEAAQLALAALHDVNGEWATTPRIVDFVLMKKGIAELNGKDRERFSSSVTMALSRYHQRGVVERSTSVGDHREYSWRLSPDLFRQATP